MLLDRDLSRLPWPRNDEQANEQQRMECLHVAISVKMVIQENIRSQEGFQSTQLSCPKSSLSVHYSPTKIQFFLFYT